MPGATPYSYAANNPVCLVDVDGLAPGGGGGTATSGQAATEDDSHQTSNTIVENSGNFGMLLPGNPYPHAIKVDLTKPVQYRNPNLAYEINKAFLNTADNRATQEDLDRWYMAQYSEQSVFDRAMNMERAVDIKYRRDVAVAEDPSKVQRVLTFQDCSYNIFISSGMYLGSATKQATSQPQPVSKPMVRPTSRPANMPDARRSSNRIDPASSAGTGTGRGTWVSTMRA